MTFDNAPYFKIVHSPTYRVGNDYYEDRDKALKEFRIQWVWAIIRRKCPTPLESHIATFMAENAEEMAAALTLDPFNGEVRV